MLNYDNDVKKLFAHADINECLNLEAYSSQVCTNSNGSYICSCNPGSILSVDMKTCAGYLNSSPYQCMITALIVLIYYQSVFIFTTNYTVYY